MGNKVVGQNAACWDVILEPVLNPDGLILNPDGLIILPVLLVFEMDVNDTLWGTVLKNQNDGMAQGFSRHI